MTSKARRFPQIVTTDDVIKVLFLTERHVRKAQKLGYDLTIDNMGAYCVTTSEEEGAKIANHVVGPKGPKLTSVSEEIVGRMPNGNTGCFRITPAAHTRRIREIRARNRPHCGYAY